MNILVPSFEKATPAEEVTFAETSKVPAWRAVAMSKAAVRVYPYMPLVPLKGLFNTNILVPSFEKTMLVGSIRIWTEGR